MIKPEIHLNTGFDKIILHYISGLIQEEFCMLGKLFRKKEKVGSLFAPIIGKVIKMEDVPDKMFNEKMHGDGIAIEQTEGVVVAPLDGEVHKSRL